MLTDRPVGEEGRLPARTAVRAGCRLRLSAVAMLRPDVPEHSRPWGRFTGSCEHPGPREVADPPSLLNWKQVAHDERFFPIGF